MVVKSAIIVALVAFAGYLISKWIRLYGVLDFDAGKTTQMLNTSYDYIVVGGGSAGAVVASRLSEDPAISVLLLEVGGEETDTPTFHIPGFATSHIFTDIDRGYQIERQTRAHPNRPPGNEEIWNAGRVLGGGSIINYMQYARGSKYDYDSWEQAGCTGWSYNDVLPYFLKSEDIQVDNLKDSKYHATGGFMGVTDAGASDHPLFEKFIKAGQELGYEQIDHNGEADIGFSPHYWTGKQGLRSGPARDLLRKAMQRPNIHVSIKSMVTKVDIQDKVAVGVEFISTPVNKKQNIKAKQEVILSAGTFESAKLLMLSGIGPSEVLKEKNIPIIAELPVGANMQYHLMVPVWSSTNDTNFAFPTPSVVDFLQYLAFDTGKLASPIAVGVAFTRVGGTKEGLPDVQIGLSPYKLPSIITGLPELAAIDAGPGLTFVLFLSHPKSIGYLGLRSFDPFDPPVLEPNYFSNEEDIERLISAIRFTKKIMLTESMKSLNLSIGINKIGPCNSEVFESDAYWTCFIRNVVTGIHQSGSCKMGDASDPTTVVDAKLRVKGIKGFRVVDASVMPSVVSGNINAPCIMIGEKGADLILKDLKVDNL